MNSFAIMSEITPKPVQYLWPPYVPAGEITVIDGDPGTNKSCITLDLAARTSTGRPMPDGTTHEAGGVVFLSAEDSITKTLPLRLQAAGADLDRIAAIEGGVTIPADLGMIEQQVCQIGAKLVIIDPLMAFFQPDANSDQKVRQALTPLKKFAERQNLAVILVRHLNKSGGRYSLYRGSGSIGIVGATRSALLVGPDPEDPNMRVLCHVKSNLAPKGPSLLFEPVGHENGAVRIEWRGECQYTADDLLKRPKYPGSKQEEAIVFLLETLSDGPIEQVVVQQKAAALGIAYRTVERAKTLLGIESHRQGFGPGSEILWKLPASQGEVTCPMDEFLPTAVCHRPPTRNGGLWREPRPNPQGG